MDFPELIRKKRDGDSLTRQEIFEFVDRYTRGEIPDYQCSALLMAIFFRGLSGEETANLTEAMMKSGATLDLSEYPQPKVDKHSTGGVGDKTSLVIAPVAAAGGLMVPMISGRGLGHTGGTLDKLESIPGFDTHLSLPEFRRILGTCGMGLMGQTDDLAPADRKLYSLRDVTATVESIPLISASIMSKKLAEGIDGLVLDVKTGSGAFMKKLEDSRALAARMVEIGRACGKRVTALITDMNQPLGCAVGNALEVIECFETLKGRGPRDLAELSRELTACMLVVGGVEKSMDSARAKYDALLAGGKPLEIFTRVIAEQGGDPKVVEDYNRLPSAKIEESMVAAEDGWVAELEAFAIGRASMVLGAGRERLDSVIDKGVGLVFEKKVGERVTVGERICVLYANDAALLKRAREMLRPAIRISRQPAATPVLIHETV
ncbi:MAG TPA: thymidine phosphorylase [Terriglobia bacterium]|nr:thymidine phosphorylase [Terriglobia bacterium]